jgi:tetratricopeptide (TPR) repeat protein
VGSRPLRWLCRAAASSWLLALGLALPVGDAHAEPSWATAQAAELTRQGDAHAARGDLDVALGRYLQAIGLDATYGPAYLGLGRARELGGDPVEAERAYSMGIEHVPAFGEAFVARAHLRARTHRAREALADLELASAARPDDLTTLGELRDAYVAAGALPAALGTARRMAAVAGAANDERAIVAAQISARALGALVGEVDPVAAGLHDRGPVRRALALFARGAKSRH